VRESFRDAVKREVERRDLVERSPGRWLGPAALVLGLAGAAWFVLSLFGVNVGALISLVLSSFIGFVGAGLVVWVVFRRVFGNAGSALHRLWVRRTPKGALLYARWQAFRRYLKDFSRMKESPPASLALWEQFLVYGIALGVAEQVLEAARLHAPPEIAEGGSFYSSGIVGSISGPYVFSFSNLENDFSDAFSPPSSSGSWSGGGSAAAVVVEAVVAGHGSRDDASPQKPSPRLRARLWVLFHSVLLLPTEKSMGHATA